MMSLYAFTRNIRASAVPVIYYPFTVPPITGGDFVNIEHVNGLVAAGFNARVLYCACDDGLGRFMAPAVRLGGVQLQPDDFLVIGESHRELLRQARTINIRRVLHNQGAFNTFHGFNSIEELNAYPFTHVLVNSDFVASKLRMLGVNLPINRVRPSIPDYFKPQKKYLAIAYSPAKRPTEALFLPQYFRALSPEHANVHWIALSGKTRRQCADVLGVSSIFASFAMLEGLGLMALEAMASGCRVIGYTGEGGREYATAENGDWIADYDHDGFVAALRQACDSFISGAADEKVRCGMITAARFSYANFQRELLESWSQILAADIHKYRL